MSLDSLPNYETQLSGSEALVNESTMGDDYSWDMARAMENIGDNMSDIFPCTPPEAQFLNDTYSDKESSVNETDDNPVDTFDAETDLDDEFAPTSAEIFSKLTNQTKRAFILQSFIEKLSIADCHQKLNALFPGSFNYSTVKLWYHRFRRGDYSCRSKVHKGPSFRVSSEKLRQYILEHPFAEAGEMASEFGYSIANIYRRMKKLNYVLKLDQWVPYKLSNANMANRVAICNQLLTKLRNEPLPFLGYVKAFFGDLLNSKIKWKNAKNNKENQTKKHKELKNKNFLIN